MNPVLQDLKPNICYLAFGKPNGYIEEEKGCRILVMFVKKSGKFHGLRVVVKPQPGWDTKALIDFYVEKMRTHLWQTHYPKRELNLPVKKLKERVELENFKLAKNPQDTGNPFAIY